jgi:very-short-patch-repair endonuclease
VHSLRHNLRLPTPTLYERKLSRILSSKGIPHKLGRVIWYTRADYYTPDFIIGNRLLIKVDGSIHSREFRKTPDRIRHRALQNLGYVVYRVTNTQIRESVQMVAQEIIQHYYETIDHNTTEPKIEEIRKPTTYDTIPKLISDNINQWAISFSENLSEESWNSSYFRTNLAKYHSALVTNQSALERFLLLLLGLNLNTDNGGKLNFDKLVKLFNRSILIIEELFEESGSMASVHMKNMFNVSAPGFFKNLVLIGGPRIKPGIVTISNLSTLKMHIDDFNRYFSSVGGNVEESEVKTECIYSMEKMDNNSQFSWLREW